MPLILNTRSHFGEQLKEIRKRKNISQLKLAAKMGCDSSNISHFEKGNETFGNGSIQTVFKYARALGFKKVTFKL